MKQTSNNLNLHSIQMTLLPAQKRQHHPETISYRGRVAANGGTVSASLLKMLNKFVLSLYAAELRGKFSRMNLFCSPSRSVSEVPLFFNNSGSSEPLGNFLDTIEYTFPADNTNAGIFGSLTACEAPLIFKFPSGRYIHCSENLTLFPLYSKCNSNQIKGVTAGLVPLAGYSLGEKLLPHEAKYLSTLINSLLKSSGV